MEFIFELFAEMLGRNEAPDNEARGIEAMDANAEANLEARDSAETGSETTVEPLNIFNIVNFH